MVSDGYMMTMDAMVQWVLAGARRIRVSQLVVLAAEGVGVAGIAACYMWILSQRVGDCTWLGSGFLIGENGYHDNLQSLQKHNIAC